MLAPPLEYKYALVLARSAGHPEGYRSARTPLPINLEPVDRVPQYPRCITH